MKTRTPKQQMKRMFSILELVIALMVVVIGIVGIMGLFPVGLNSNRIAKGENNAADAADQFLRYFASEMKRNWQITNSVPISKADADAETEALWNNRDSNDIFGDVEGVALYYNDEDNDNKFDFRIDEDTGDLSLDSSGLFKIVQKTASNIVDFEGVLRVWKSTATYKSYNAQTGEWSGLKPVSPDAGMSINVELSWPAAKPYAQRQKSQYHLDVYRPGQHDLDMVKGAFRIISSGTMKFTYHGSSAGITSGFFMLNPTEQEIFAQNQSTPQDTVVETTFSRGTSFNFFSRSYAGNWGGSHMGTYEHYAWADEGSDMYWDWDNPAGVNPRNGAYDYLSGNPYCMVTELIPNQKWLLGFEDLPADRNGDGRQDWIDWDYNDIVVTAELIVDDNEPSVAKGVSVDGNVTLNPNGGDWRLTLTLPDGTSLHRDVSGLSGGYDGPAIAVWMRPTGSGSQSLSVNGNTVDFDNQRMVAVSSEDMTVNVSKTNGVWHCVVHANNAIFNVMN